jgi:short-subunit dehydrogenase
MGLRTKIRRYLYARKFKNKNILELNYSGKNIFITGANSGIGLELTHKFLNLNNKVFATYRNNSENLKKINNKNLTLIKCDQKNLSEIENIKKEIKNIPINLLINNAGIFGPPYSEQKLENLNFQNFQDTLMINSLSVIKITQVILNAVKKNTLNMIVNISSEGGSITRNDEGNAYIYRTSKSALNSITKNMSLDLFKNYNIVVFAIDPGNVQSGMNPGGIVKTPVCANLIINIIASQGKKLNGKFINLLNKEIPW